MNKKMFAETLRSRLSGLPREDAERSVEFYCEMIDDRMEEGMTEEEAVAEIGPIDDVISQIMSEMPLTDLVKAKVKPKRALRAWEIVLLVLGSPVWLSILIAVLAVVVSLYITVWSVIISLWSVWISILCCGVGGLISACVLMMQGNLWLGALMLGAGLVCAGVSIFMYMGCKAVTKGWIMLTKKILKPGKENAV